MNRLEIAKLLTQISAIDNRHVTEATVEMWFRVLASCSFDDAEFVVPKIFRESESYLTPNMVYAEVKKLREERKQKQLSIELREEHASSVVDRQPECARHGLKITKCDECCAIMANEANNLSGDAFYAWADENVLK